MIAKAPCAGGKPGRGRPVCGITTLHNVIFVDDNPAERAEVQSAHPDLERLLFTTTAGPLSWRSARRRSSIWSGSI